jgi:hypothetical protein
MEGGIIMDEKEIYSKEFIPTIIKWGALTLWLAIIFSFGPPFYLWVAYKLVPSWGAIWRGFGLTVAAVGAFYIVEPISYFAVLGIPGTYQGFLSGNISNLKLPASAVAQEASGVQEGTERGSIVSSIAVGISVIVTIVLLFIGAFVTSMLVKHLPPFLTHAFSYILPAIFGAIFGQFFIRDVTLGVIALAMGLALNASKVIPSWGVILICVFGTILVARIRWSRQKKLQSMKK